MQSCVTMGGTSCHHPFKSATAQTSRSPMLRSDDELNLKRRGWLSCVSKAAQRNRESRWSAPRAAGGAGGAGAGGHHRKTAWRRCT